MKLLLKYMKPYRGLAIVTVLVLMVDIAGTLLVPTLLANMVNIGVATKNFNYILQNGLAMLGATALARCWAAICPPSWLPAWAVTFATPCTIARWRFPAATSSASAPAP